MSQVVSFEDFTPPARYDAVPWEQIEVQEADEATGPWTTIDTIAISPLDSDPVHPAAQSFTTSSADERVGLWYQIVFLDGAGNDTLPTVPVQNLLATIVAANPYASVSELTRILKIRTPSGDQTAALERVLRAAAGEINSEIGRANTDLSSWELDLAAQVNLDRAADLWRHTESIPGVTGILGDDGGPVLPGRYSWERYAQRLAPLKQEWGLA